MRKYRGVIAGICIISMLASFTACGNSNQKKETGSTSGITSSEAKKDTSSAEAEPTEEATEAPKEITEFGSFVCQSKVKKTYKIPKVSKEEAMRSSYLKSWKNSDVKKQIVKFVNDVTDEKSKNYIPPEDRIVVTDIDGTLIAEKGKKVNNDEMIKLTPAEVKDYLLEIQDTNFSEQTKITYAGILYQPMREMYYYLKANGFDIFFVSGNCNALTYAWADYYFGADYLHCVGSDIEIDSQDSDTDGFKMGPNGKSEGCWNELKSYRIYNHIGKCPVLAFGNSDGDVQMLDWVTQNKAYKSLSVMINHDDEREYVYSVDKMSAFCEQRGFLDAKMSENFKTIYIK